MYGRVMTEQLDLYMRRGEESNLGSNDFSTMRTVVRDAKKHFPDLSTNPDYELV